MGELEKIAIGKAHASGRDIVARLRSEMNALERGYSARGMGGGIVGESKKLCTLALSEQGKAVAGHFEWVITESLWTSQAEVDRYVGLCRERIEPVLEASREIVKRATDLTGLQKHLPEYLVELETARDEVWTDIDLSLRAAAATAKRRKFRSVVEGTINWVSKLFGRSK